VGSDARVAGFVGEAILVAPAVVRHAICEFLISSSVGARSAKWSFEAGLRWRVGLLESIEGDIGLPPRRPRRARRFGSTYFTWFFSSVAVVTSACDEAPNGRGCAFQRTKWLRSLHFAGPFLTDC
jgi:hypothetical protein